MAVIERRTVWASTRAAICVVTELMDVHATLGRGIVALDIVGDGGRRRLGLLLEGDGALDVGVTAEYSNYIEVDSQLPC